MENHHEQTAGLATRCVHSGTQFDGAVRGVNTPIHTSSAFGYDPDVTITYPRYFNTPNQHAVTNKLCALEHTEAGLLFSSGMAAISTAMLTFLPQGSHVVLQPIIYGGTHNFVVKQLEQHGVTYTYAASAAVDDLEAAIQPNTKVVYIETPSNPLLSLTDVAAVAQMARRHGLPSENERVLVVFGEIVRNSGDAAVHLTAAQALCVYNLSGSRFDERRAT